MGPFLSGLAGPLAAIRHHSRSHASHSPSRHPRSAPNCSKKKKKGAPKVGVPAVGRRRHIRPAAIRQSPTRLLALAVRPARPSPPSTILNWESSTLIPSTPPPSTPPRFQMASEDSKDMLKNVDWKTVGGAVTTESSQPVIKKRLPKKIRQVPECYFLPRRSLPSALAIYGAVCAAGVGAGMLLEVWINKKIKEDGGIIWEMDK
ncbi:hypothetical protein PVAP13_2NG587540 [Panicum virgatum]|nr:hypothetical protein PVAP13_2NG587540 [Panicum virgatum]